MDWAWRQWSKPWMWLRPRDILPAQSVYYLFAPLVISLSSCFLKWCHLEPSGLVGLLRNVCTCSKPAMFVHFWIELNWIEFISTTTANLIDHWVCKLREPYWITSMAYSVRAGDRQCRYQPLCIAFSDLTAITEERRRGDAGELIRWESLSTPSHCRLVNCIHQMPPPGVN